MFTPVGTQREVLHARPDNRGTRKRGRGLGVGLGPYSTRGGSQKPRTSGRSGHTVRHQAVRAQSGSQFQGGVLKGPLYNGQDYLGDDPDPNIRSFLIRDKSRYGGQD